MIVYCGRSSADVEEEGHTIRSVARKVAPIRGMLL
jgi:hypothetical protein